MNKERLNSKEDHILQAIQLGMSREDAENMVNSLNESVNSEINDDGLKSELEQGVWDE